MINVREVRFTRGERTLSGRAGMSVLCQEQTCALLFDYFVGYNE